MKEDKQKKYKPVKTPIIYQMELTECGAASLAMIFHYYGVYIPLEQLRIDTGVSRDGCKASKIVQGAKKYGFQASGHKMGLNALFNTKPPCIVHWHFNHFLVYEGKKGDYIYLSDPAEGKRKLTLEEFDDGFTGVVLQIQPTDDVKKSKNPYSSVKFLKNRLKGYQTDIFYLFLSGLLLVFPGIFIPLLSEVIIDDVLIGGQYSLFPLLLSAILLFGVMEGGFNFYRSRILVKLQTKMSLISSYFFLHHMFKLNVSFFDQRYAGDLTNRVENSNRIDEFLAGEFASNVLNVMVAFFYLIILFWYNLYLTLIGLVFILMNGAVIKIASGLLAKTITKVQQDEGKLVGVVYSGISIMSTLKASGIENKYVSRILGYYSKFMGGKQNNTKVQQILNVMPDMMRQLSSILVLVIGGCFVISGEMSVGSLAAYGTLLALFMNPVNELTGFVQKLQMVKTDMNRVEDIYQYEKGENKKELPVMTLNEKLSGKVALNNISFGYSPLEPPLIEAFNFTLQPGKSIAFVGSSGSGKSTISKILSGLYAPWKGEVVFDDINLEQIPKEVVTGSISTVSQEISIFSGSIRENITMWNKAIREEDVIRAAKDALIHEVIIEKPGAYDYHLEEGGRNISGGQRQRIEIARALVNNPNILILDEATSALDALTEKEIVDNIKRRGLSCIIVAHRLSAIRDCDEIIVLNRGKVVQRGTHEELIEKEGAYKELFS